MDKYICNAFSLQMIDGGDFETATIKFDRVTALPEGLLSAIGHADTARVLGYEPNRISVSLEFGGELYIAQITGGRLSEGSTELPPGVILNLYKATRLE